MKPTDMPDPSDESSERIPLDEVIRNDDSPADTSVPLTDRGGVVDESRVIDENADNPQAGTPGHRGIDEDTA